jgi:Ca-activated chloride channel family protein
MHWIYPHQAWWLLAVAAFGVFAAWAVARKLRGLRVFRVAGMDASGGRGRPLLKLGLRCAAVVLLGLAILGPSWGEQVIPTAPPPRGRDVLIVLDVSRSMLAEDVAPNRLDHAKAGLRLLAQRLERQGGYRIGLIAFADRAALLCPLTTDFRHFFQELNRITLETLRVRRDGPSAGDGTQFHLALTRALHALPVSAEPASCDVLLVSDGGDELDESARAVVTAFAERKVPVHTVGIGDPARESPIPVKLPNGTRDYLRYQGEQVRVRLQEEPLVQIAKFTGGVYLPARTGPLPLEPLLARWDAQAGRVLEVRGEIREPIHRFEWFLLPSILLLLLDNLVPERGRSAGTGPRRSPWLVRLVYRPRRPPVRTTEVRP